MQYNNNGIIISKTYHIILIWLEKEVKNFDNIIGYGFTGSLYVAGESVYFYKHSGKVSFSVKSEFMSIF